ncbi:hypothetical protein IQ07DRAFT_598228 [Pyrenochaeta sp. DS3sAY3a]|nr:hypothetical protein IQ07DRAFT_598228 [Pyrenochaeta sp. DS3sAY3a]
MQFQDSVRLLHFWILAFLHLSLLVYAVSSRVRDEDFRRCFPADSITLLLTGSMLVLFYGYFFLLSSDRTPSSEDDMNPDYKVSRWLIALAISVGFVVAQFVQLIYIMRAFRGPARKMDSEIELGFGQVLMFFMILQLVAEFGRGLWLDLDRIHQYFAVNGGSIPRSFVIFCSVLVPLLPGKLRQEILHIWYSGPKRLAHKSKKWLLSTLCKSSEWLHSLFKKPLRRTKTTVIESGRHNSSTQSLKLEKQDENSEEETPADVSGSREPTDQDEILPIRSSVPRLTL